MTEECTCSKNQCYHLWSWYNGCDWAAPRVSQGNKRACVTGGGTWPKGKWLLIGNNVIFFQLSRHLSKVEELLVRFHPCCCLSPQRCVLDICTVLHLCISIAASWGFCLHEYVCVGWGWNNECCASHACLYLAFPIELSGGSSPACSLSFWAQT